MKYKGYIHVDKKIAYINEHLQIFVKEPKLQFAAVILTTDQVKNTRGSLDIKKYLNFKRKHTKTTT